MKDYWDEFMETLEEVEICPYCGTQTSFGCCGEVHNITAFMNESGDIIMYDELESYYKYYVLKKENLNRNFIDIEQDEKYFQIAVDRIKGAK